jgi:hypothetical protein
VAQFVWAALLVVPILFLGVVVALGRPSHELASAPPDLLLALAIATSAIGVGLSRVVPPRIPPRQGALAEDLTALTRLVVAWSLCEAVAIFPIVAFLVTRQALLLPVLALDLLALVLLYPSPARWEASRAVAAPRRAPPARMVR